jgi:hypothetical protein
VKPKWFRWEIIDSAFLVDDEGGPFTFTKVSYDLDQNRIDLRYNRRQYTSAAAPADFRLVGKFNQKGAIEGNVLSGNRGPIGTFKMSPVDTVGLKVKKKYLGPWSGRARMLPSGHVVDFDIVLSEGLEQATNPFELEFEYTVGKMAYYALDGVKFNFNQVVIDYLRQRLILLRTAVGRNVVTAECDIDFAGQTMRGSLYGANLGKSADLSLRKVN